jgi:ABC-type multidrug transport system fused ATPase/permease subunit
VVLKSKSGELVSRLGRDTTLLQTVVSQNLPDFVTQLIKAITAIVLMFYLSVKLAGLALGGIVIIFLLSTPMGKLMAKLSKQYQDILGQAQMHSTEATGSMRTVQKKKQDTARRLEILMQFHCGGLKRIRLRIK